MLSLGAGHSLQLDVIRIKGSTRQCFIRSESGTDAQSLGNSNVDQQEDNKHDSYVKNKNKIENGYSPQLGIIQIAFRRSLDAAHHVQQLVTAIWYEGVNVEREPRLQRPQPLQTEGGAEGSIGHEQLRLAGEGQAHYGGERRDSGGDRGAFGLEIGGLQGGGGGGEGVFEEEERGADGEEEIQGEREERRGVGEEEGESEDEEGEQQGGGLERGEEVDGGAAFDEGIGVGGDEKLVDDCDDDAEDDEVELQMSPAVVVVVVGGGGEGEGMVGFCGVIGGEFKVVSGGGD